jgi:hypothetical protein
MKNLNITNISDIKHLFSDVTIADDYYIFKSPNGEVKVDKEIFIKGDNMTVGIRLFKNDNIGMGKHRIGISNIRLDNLDNTPLEQVLAILNDLK